MTLIPSGRLEKTFLFAALTAVGIYFSAFLCYSLNMPLTDDYYDNLYFLLMSNQAQSLQEKLQLLLWQYDEKKFVLNRLTYLAWQAVSGAINFRQLSLLANLYLPLFAFLLWKTSPTVRKSHLNLLILCLFLFSFGHYQSSYWTMSAISNFSAMVFALGSFYLLSRSGWACFTFSAALAWLATFSMANGLLILPLGILSILLQQPRHPNIIRLLLWSISSVLCGLLYFHGHEKMSFELVALTYPEAFPNAIDAATGQGMLRILLSCFALLGALPFDTADPATIAVLMGVILGAVLVVSVIWHKRLGIYLEDHVFVFLLFLLASLAVIALIRAPMYGLENASFTSRYKNISSTAIALLFIALVNSSVLQKIWPRLKYVLLTLSLLLFAYSYYRFIPVEKKWYGIERSGITSWAIKGDQAALGLSGWYYLSHEILSEAVKAGIYQPFSRHGVNFQPESIKRIDQCPAVPPSAPEIHVNINAKPEAVGVRLVYHDASKEISSLVLCGDAVNYELTVGSDDHRIDGIEGKFNLIFSKLTLNPGVYRILLKHQSLGVLRSDNTLLISPYTPVYTCDESMFDTSASRKIMVTNVCKEYRKTH